MGSREVPHGQDAHAGNCLERSGILWRKTVTEPGTCEGRHWCSRSGRGRTRVHRTRIVRRVATTSAPRPRIQRRGRSPQLAIITRRIPPFSPAHAPHRRRSVEMRFEKGRIQRATPRANWQTHPSSIPSTWRGRRASDMGGRAPLLAANRHAPAVAPRAKCSRAARTNQTLIRGIRWVCVLWVGVNR